jgi:hypothetical protein
LGKIYFRLKQGDHPVNSRSLQKLYFINEFKAIVRFSCYLLLLNAASTLHINLRVFVHLNNTEIALSFIECSTEVMVLRIDRFWG